MQIDPQTTHPAIASQDFLPTQRRQWVLLFIFMLLILTLLQAALWGGRAPKPGLAIGLLILFVPLLWLFGRFAFDKRPVLTVSEAGISSRHLRHDLAWQELADVELQQMYNAASLTLVLHPDARRPDRRRFGIGRNPSRPQIPLQLLKPADQQRALQAIHARLRTVRHAQGLGETASALEAQRLEAFERRLVSLTPHTWALYLMVAANVAVWLTNVAMGMNAFKPSPAELFGWGANSAYAVVHDHEYWRLFTAMFLHGGLLHLALNMLGLWEAGRQLCRWFGNRQFLVIYLGSGLVGSALSLHFSSQQSVSVGASGAVFGVLGALVTAALQHRKQLPSMLTRRLLTGQGVFIAYALVQGLAQQGIDNAAHIGGLLAGGVLAWMLVERIDTQASGARRLGHGLVALASCVLGIAALVGSTSATAVDHRSLFAGTALLQKLSPELQRAEQALQRDIQQLNAGKLTEAALTDAIRQQHLPAYRQLRDQLDTVVKAYANVGDAAAREPLLDIREHTGLLTEMMELDVQKTGRSEAEQAQADVRSKELAARLAAVSQRIMKRNGQKNAPKAGNGGA